MVGRLGSTHWCIRACELLSHLDGCPRGHPSRVFDITGAEIGLLHSAFFYVYAPMQLFAGILADRSENTRDDWIGPGVWRRSAPQ